MLIDLWRFLRVLTEHDVSNQMGQHSTRTVFRRNEMGKYSKTKENGDKSRSKTARTSHLDSTAQERNGEVYGLRRVEYRTNICRYQGISLYEHRTIKNYT